MYIYAERERYIKRKWDDKQTNKQTNKETNKQTNNLFCVSIKEIKTTHINMDKSYMKKNN